MLRDFDIQTLYEFLEEAFREDELNYLKEKEKQKIQKTDDGIKIKKSKEFVDYFIDIQTQPLWTKSP